eukprot:Pgem_evm1s12561
MIKAVSAQKISEERSASILSMFLEQNEKHQNDQETGRNINCLQTTLQQLQSLNNSLQNLSNEQEYLQNDDSE